LLGRAHMAPFFSVPRELESQERLLHDSDRSVNALEPSNLRLYTNLSDACTRPRWPALTRTVQAVLPYAIGWLAVMALVRVINIETKQIADRTAGNVRSSKPTTARRAPAWSAAFNHSSGTATHELSTKENAAFKNEASLNKQIAHAAAGSVSSSKPTAPLAPAWSAPFNYTNGTIGCSRALTLRPLHSLEPGRRACDFMLSRLHHGRSIAACQTRCDVRPDCVGYVLTFNRSSSAQPMCKVSKCEAPLLAPMDKHTSKLRVCKGWAWACGGTPLVRGHRINGSQTSFIAHFGIQAGMCVRGLPA